MTNQINCNPEQFEITKYFGPFIARVKIPQDILLSLNKMTDSLILNPERASHGQYLAGVINQEKRLYKSDMIKAGVDKFLETVVRTYIINSAKSHSLYSETYQIKSYINDAWTVSQYENEYNPVHNHGSCEISGVIYLKIPDVKGRRQLTSKINKRDSDGDIKFIWSASSQREGDVFENGMIQLAPEAGLMLLFPSYLLHTVYPFIGGGERRSIAFNARYQIIDLIDNQIQYIAGNKEGLSTNTHYKDI